MDWATWVQELGGYPAKYTHPTDGEKPFDDGAKATVNGKRHEGIVPFGVNSRTQSFETPVLFVYTDRGVYNPGQVIHIRAVAWNLRGEFSPLADKSVEILLSDGQKKVVAGGKVQTDRFGVGFMDITLPENMVEGVYTLTAVYQTARETAAIRVKRFVPPVIAITPKVGRFLTPAVKILTIPVALGYFTGGPGKGGVIVGEIVVKEKVVWTEKQTMRSYQKRFDLVNPAAIRRDNSCCPSPSPF